MKSFTKTLLKKGDEVQLIRGFGSGRTMPVGEDEQGKVGARGRIRDVLLAEGKVIVEGLRKAKKATRPDPNKGHRGGFVEQEVAIPMSNVMLVCSSCDRPVRVKVVVDEQGKKTRTCRKCSETI